jgi:hypothetical protein
MREKTLEIVYTWDDGREEVRYRRTPHDSDDAKELTRQVEKLQSLYAGECPYSWRIV